MARFFFQDLQYVMKWWFLNMENFFFFLQGRVRIKSWMRKHDTESLKTHLGSLRLRVDTLKLCSHLEEQREDVSPMIKATFGLGEDPCVPSRKCLDAIPSPSI